MRDREFRAQQFFNGSIPHQDTNLTGGQGV
jgi:hypothetical protein